MESKFPILAELTEEERALIGEAHIIPDQTELFSEGEQCHYLPLLLEGNVRVYKIAESGRELSFSRLGGGQACVLVTNCILENKPFPAFAVASGELKVLKIPASALTKFMEKYPSWKQFVWGMMSQCVSRVIHVAEEVVCQPLDQRLARYLLQSFQEYDDPVLRRTHEEVSRELNCTREVVSRLLKNFEKRDLVKLSRGKITILNLNQLAYLN